MDDETARRKAQNRAAAANNALPVLIARAGGSVEITREEFLEVASRYGGASRMVVLVEAVDGRPDAMRLTLGRKEPEQGSLPQ